MKKIAFVVPWYSEEVSGGAETACRMLAKNLRLHGADVEILTTCVRDFRADWSENYFPQGPASEGGIPVRRFPVTKTNRRRFDEVNSRLMLDCPPADGDEQVYLREMLNSPALYAFIEQNAAGYVFLFLPYLFSTTYWGSRAAGESAVLIPCLHEEAYARLPAFREMFANASGVIFLSRAERDLARALFPGCRESGVLGLPLDCSCGGAARSFSEKFGWKNFLLYAGRTDPGKNAGLLVEYFTQYLRNSPGDLHLLFIGTEESPYPPELRANIHSLGFLSEQDKRDCFAAALALCVPSVVESFSIVMMESWIAGRPVIANARCPVTSAFCSDSNGGLWFENFAEFSEIVDYLRANPAAADAMGRSGAAFVRKNFEPAQVARNYLDALAPLLHGARRDVRD